MIDQKEKPGTLEDDPYGITGFFCQWSPCTLALRWISFFDKKKKVTKKEMCQLKKQEQNTAYIHSIPILCPECN